VKRKRTASAKKNALGEHDHADTVYAITEVTVPMTATIRQVLSAFFDWPPT